MGIKDRINNTLSEAIKQSEDLLQKGKKLINQEEATSTGIQQEKVGTIVCKACGGPVPVNANACPYCGTVNTNKLIEKEKIINHEHSRQQFNINTEKKVEYKEKNVNINFVDSGPHCPRCGSTNVSAKTKKKKSGLIKKSVATVATCGANIVVGATSKAIKGDSVVMICHTCHKEFKLK